MSRVEVGEHLVIDPEILHGRMTFKGTRVPVSLVLEYLEDGLPIDEVERHWPQVSRAAAQEAVRLAAESLCLRYQAELRAAADESERCWEAIDAAAGGARSGATSPAQSGTDVVGR